ncbi:hypothetical protein BC834DRAFT_812782, partial [Gloeopeniophorella convolvens]
TSLLVLDRNERVIAAFLGHPAEDGRPEAAAWGAACSRLADRFERLRREASRRAEGSRCVHRRGDFAAVSFGVSYGGGQRHPMNLRATGRRARVVRELRGDGDLRRLAGFASEGLASYFPLAFDHMREGLLRLKQQAASGGTPPLDMPFSNSAYPTATANLGPSTACFEHRDSTNYPGIACAITPLGSFDPATGGHLILFDLRLYVRLPAGTTALISSAGLRHGNTPIGPRERRYSFTQYCVGGLLRWAAHGGR